MRTIPVIVCMVLFISLVSMGCEEDSSNDSPRAVLSLEPAVAWIFDNATTTEDADITFNATDSSDPDGEIRNYHYVFGEGNTTDLGNPTFDRTYEEGGEYITGLTVSDDEGATDSVEQILIVNYQYQRTGQVLDATTGSSTSDDHPFPVSLYHPDTGEVEVIINAPDVGSPPSVNITVYNEDDEVVAEEREENINGNVTITIELRNQDFTDYGSGQWRVEVECENGSIQYDITTQVLYKR